MDTSTASLESSVPIHLHITGFSRFGNIEVNPSAMLMETLPAYLQKYPINDKRLVIQTVAVLPVSAEKVRNHIAQCKKQTVYDGSYRTIHLHFGLNARASRVRVETTAYNVQTFRIPDIDGYQPKELKIMENEPDVLEAKLPMEAIVTQMQADGFAIESSTDPGRYVCNLIYFLSLVMEKHTEPHSMRSLFVHVPLFETQPLIEQLRIIRELLEQIAKKY